MARKKATEVVEEVVEVKNEEVVAEESKERPIDLARNVQAAFARLKASLKAEEEKKKAAAAAAKKAEEERLAKEAEEKAKRREEAIARREERMARMKSVIQPMIDQAIKSNKEASEKKKAAFEKFFNKKQNKVEVKETTEAVEAPVEE